ncbi:MAG: DegT/DnrJ/EryC1/StrS aminotransferase [Chthoniobacteraceae bacterium]|nr:DegT/DnrJ/EryC1/StrS aminotransferase [Chthoniobacteraceae bacterium]
MQMHDRIWISPPHMGVKELQLVQEAFESNWIAPLGPHVDAFEQEVSELVGVSHAAALSSGTAAIHLALKLLGVRRGDDVFCSTLTFAASANPILYEGARPVFIDSEEKTWNMDSDLLYDELLNSAARGNLPKAVIVVDLYGQCADYSKISDVCNVFGVPIIEDAAEALGSSYENRMAGSFGRLGVFSFNGNKIITTSGGGMLVSEDASLIEQARFLSAQSRDPSPHYEHSVVGYNYRMSNVLAGIGRGQLRLLQSRVHARRCNRFFYESALSDIAGLRFMPLSSDGYQNCWLTAITIDPALFGATREQVRLALEEANIESRPVWKPLHAQPLFSSCRVRGGAVSERLFENGLCLPSGSNLTQEALHRVCEVIRRVYDGGE